MACTCSTCQRVSGVIARHSRGKLRRSPNSEPFIPWSGRAQARSSSCSAATLPTCPACTCHGASMMSGSTTWKAHGGPSCYARRHLQGVPSTSLGFSALSCSSTVATIVKARSRWMTSVSSTSRQKDGYELASSTSKTVAQPYSQVETCMGARQRNQTLMTHLARETMLWHR